MSIANGYTTLVKLKAVLTLAQTTHDADLERAVESASRAVDAYTGRRFYQDSTATAYYFSAEDPYLIPVIDISTATGLVIEADHNGDGTFENTFTVDSFTATYGYRLMPRRPLTGHPWTALKAISGSFPVGVDGGIKITVKAGWAAVPAEVEQATILQAARLLKRKDSPFGVLGPADIGSGSDAAVTVPKVDPDFRSLLAPLRRFDVPMEPL